jgi:tRNA dimethylallyltransferase
MESESIKPPLIVIVGQTASGKTALSLELAQQFGGEIIAADSRTIYKDMNTSTAKPTLAEQKLVKHHLLDIVTPDQPFSAAEFKRLANEAIGDISSRGKLAFLVGGSGLYVDAVLYDFAFEDKPDAALRSKLVQLSIEELQQQLFEQGIPLPSNSRNPRHLIRAIETGGRTGLRSALRANTLVLGLDVDTEVIRSNITRRVDAMIEQGLLAEIQRVAAQYGWDAPGLQTPGFKAFRAYFDGDISLKEASERFAKNDIQLAKRQRTWFKRNKDIHWICKKEESVDSITTFLNN